MVASNDDLVFLDDSEDGTGDAANLQPWRVLVVDDDQDVHEATRFGLAHLLILGRPLELLHAHSAREALELLQREGDIAVILLDVVMESDDAGLRTVGVIREQLKMLNTRIILRTGQPGQAPEADTIARYDINDYKTKSELTQNKLFTTLTAAIRSYDQLLRLDANRRGLEKIVSASNQFIAEKGLRTFAEGVITQIASLIGVDPEGVVCAASEESTSPHLPGDFRVIAAAGDFRDLIQQRLQDIDNPAIMGPLMQSLESRRSVIQPRSITLYFRKSEDEGFAAYIASSTPIRHVDEELLQIFCTNIALWAKNIDLVSELRRDAFVDRQLSLPNRTALVYELNERIQAGREKGQCLVVLDLDQFAAVNDVLGHDHGDALLRKVAKRLREGLPPDTYIARLSGDSFAVVGPCAAVHRDSVQACFATPFVIHEARQPVSACLGIVRLGTTSASGIEYIKDAFVALKRAKSQGLGSAVEFSQDIGLQERERSHLLRDLRMAFDESQLFLTYQPKVELATGRVVGAEALLRWRRDDGCLVPPDRFIPVAEQSGLIVGMGSWLLQIALLALQRFRAAGFPNMHMAVNLSPVQLRQTGFLAVVQEALRQTQSEASALEIEITESVAVGGLEPVIDILTRLREMGSTVAIDDFGTGYSSLSYLERLPADRLKIDRSFVQSLERDDHGSRIARTIIALGRELGLTIVAEGVENETVGRLVTALGCAEAQGYHYGRPMSEEQFLEWLQVHQKGIA